MELQVTAKTEFGNIASGMRTYQQKLISSYNMHNGAKVIKKVIIICAL